MMAKFGKGSARVDLGLYQNKVSLGGQVKGELVLQGGAVEQTINKIQVELYFSLKSKEKNLTHLIAVIPYKAEFVIQPEQRKVVPFELTLPEDLLITGPTVSYYLMSKLEIQGGLDSSDKDEIIITPSFDLMQALLAIEQLGFRELANSRSYNGITQEFIFTPTSFLLGKLTQISFIVALDPNQVRLLADLEINTFFSKKTKQHEIILPHSILQDVNRSRTYIQNVLMEVVEGKARNNFQPKSFAGAMGRFVTEVIREFDRRKK